MTAERTAARELARFICNLDQRDVPLDGVACCRDLLLDQPGCQLIGAGREWNQPVCRLVKETKGGGPVRPICAGNFRRRTRRFGFIDAVPGHPIKNCSGRTKRRS